MADSCELKKQLHENLRKAARDLPPELRQKLLDNLQKWKTNEKKSLSILLTGKTGSGKSTLTNGILGVAAKGNGAKEGDSIKARCTTEVESYQEDKNGVKVIVWDSPGLQDGTDHQEEYIQQMKKKCSDVDLVMYCVKSSETRFTRGSDNPDVVAMEKLTKAFGHDFWRKVVIVLTYANTLEAFNPDWIGLSDDEKGEAFNKKIEEWEEQIKFILSKDIGIPNKIIDGVKIVPAGHAKVPHLPGIEYWLSNLWFRCLFSMASPETRCALLQINLERFKAAADVDQKKDFQKPAEQQPIVVTDNTVRNMVIGGGVGGVGGGALGGFIGGFMVGGPAGALIGAGIGALLGGGGGAAIGKACS